MKVDMSLPKLLPDQKALIDAWWRETKPYFKKNDADEMLRRVVRFMENQPKLFVHLGLEHEFLFELGAELWRRQQWSRHAERTLLQSFGLNRSGATPHIRISKLLDS